MLEKAVTPKHKRKHIDYLDQPAASSKRKAGLTTVSNASSIVTEQAKTIQSKRIQSFVNKLKLKDFGVENDGV